MSVKKILLFLAIVSLCKFTYAHSIITWIGTAYYYDTNADGFIDSIAFGYSGTITERDIAQLRNVIILPPWRNFTVLSVTLPEPWTISYRVVEGRTIPNTSVTIEDRIHVIEDTLPGEGQVQEKWFFPEDRMAPVLINANLLSFTNITDSFMVTFSENVRPISNNQPFQFRAPGGVQYSVSFENAVTQNDNYFANPIQVQLMNNGDSVWINPIASISDGAGNIQQNPLNRRVILDVSKYDNALTVNDAFYYDANADGYIDSIVINISGNLEEISPNELLTMISFPQERSFSVESSVLSGNLLLLRVTQQNGQINTAVTDNDVLTVSWGIVAGKNLIKSGVVTIKDRVAPVILSAHLIDHETGNDTLYIRFSERIMNFNTVGPFRFRKNGGDEYYASLTLLSLDDGGRYIGRVNSSTEPLAIGDSVWISPSANITDIPGNIQQNPQNRRVQMTADLTGFPVMISEAIYFDDNADGFIDKIILRYTGILNFANLDIVTGAILLPPARNLSIENVNIIDSSIVLIVREGNLVPQTAVTNADRIVVSSRDLGEDGILMAGTVIATDSMAPVLISAQLEWYGPDRNTLNVTFSEPVNTVYSLSPFIFRKPEGGQYSVSLRNPTQTSGNRFSGQVVSVSNGYQLGTEDSLWINAVEQVHDLNHCYQDNPRNRRIPLTTNYHFTMRFLAENNPFQEGKRPIPAIVSETYTTNSLPVPDDGLIIIVEPDRKLNTEIPFEATISIYDVVQNPVILKKKMVLDRQRNRLYYIWNGANYNGRKVGSGTYSAVIKVKGNGTTVTKILRVGVKR